MVYDKSKNYKKLNINIPNVYYPFGIPRSYIFNTVQFLSTTVRYQNNYRNNTGNGVFSSLSLGEPHDHDHTLKGVYVYVVLLQSACSLFLRVSVILVILLGMLPNEKY